MTELEKAIVSTLAYFDIFDYPLTNFEIWKWLYFESPPDRAVTLFDVREALENSEYLKKRVSTRSGFYFFRNRDVCIAVRRKRYTLSERKFHYAKKVVRWLRYLPFVEMVGVCNTLAYNNSRRDADIDLFIITSPGRIWQTRFWVAGLLQLLKLRPVPGDTRDKICSTFFIDRAHLEVRNLAISDDIYLPYWVAQVVPLYDRGVYHAFERSNQWIRQHLPNIVFQQPSPRRSVGRARVLKKIIALPALLLPEAAFRKYQLNRLPSRLRTLANRGSEVVLSDQVLKFHDNDRRIQFLQRWQARRGEVL